ncbi:D-alanyl-D-alanine carboxypeptidase family protein [Schnuerera sp.]|uniref:D-alanyl-D-alanine carboxypeptidase family protein n=1 Tax=Schnuerera sp. TaxID=2794844 RepID=UPI002CCCDD1C|nr:D-alanyl-D-alanine carboxypeptidase family protein [Schnuerera sp.]HSH35143.1 D-alanyl-D-alanine carboxypeptidase family protein [Schnuerera sp.]
MKKKLIIFIIVMIICWSKNSFCVKPDIGAQSAILIDAKSKRVLASYNPHIKLPIASTTKIMTALIALENAKLTDKIIIDNNSVGIEGSSIYLEINEAITLEDLLYGLLLRSGNDSAIAIANYIGGDVESFSDMMNNKAMEIGAENTNFMNPHGLHDGRHYSTAYDLALITSEAMKINDFKQIVSTKTWKTDRNKNKIFYNKNKTLWEYEGGDGVKTGYTTKSGRCLVTSATRDGTQLIAVVLNDGNWFKDCYTLMDYGFENFTTYVIFEKEQFLKKIPVHNGNEEYVIAVSNDSFIFPLTKEELGKIKINLSLPESIEAPIVNGEIIGYITVYLDGQIIHKEKVIAKENVGKLGIMKRLFRKIRLNKASGLFSFYQ